MTERVTPLSVYQVTRELKKERNSLYNCLCSIIDDSIFVEELRSLYSDVPVLANLRCGLWYTREYDDTCYFKSTDGHMGNWGFSIIRLNMHVALHAARSGGVMIVDATRNAHKGGFPDALSKTIPIWCAVLNRAVHRIRCEQASTSPGTAAMNGHAPQTLLPCIKGNSVIQEDDGSSACADTNTRHVDNGACDRCCVCHWDIGLHFPLWISSNEVRQVTAKLDGWVDLLMNMNRAAVEELSQVLHKPLRPLWLSQNSRIWVDQVAQPCDLDFCPLILATASRPVHNLRRQVPMLSSTAGAGAGGEAGQSGLQIEAKARTEKTPIACERDRHADDEGGDEGCSSDEDEAMPRYGSQQVSWTYLYVPGAGDDEESWAAGLTPAVMWENYQALLQSGPSGAASLVKEVMIAAAAAANRDGHGMNGKTAATGGDGGRHTKKASKQVLSGAAATDAHHLAPLGCRPPPGGAAVKVQTVLEGTAVILPGTGLMLGGRPAGQAPRVWTKATAVLYCGNVETSPQTTNLHMHQQHINDSQQQQDAGDGVSRSSNQISEVGGGMSGTVLAIPCSNAGDQFAKDAASDLGLPTVDNQEHVHTSQANGCVGSLNGTDQRQHYSTEPSQRTLLSPPVSQAFENACRRGSQGHATPSARCSDMNGGHATPQPQPHTVISAFSHDDVQLGSCQPSQGPYNTSTNVSPATPSTVVTPGTHSATSTPRTSHTQSPESTQHTPSSASSARVVMQRLSLHHEDSLDKVDSLSASGIAALPSPHVNSHCDSPTTTAISGRPPKHATTHHSLGSPGSPTLSLGSRLSRAGSLQADGFQFASADSFVDVAPPNYISVPLQLTHEQRVALRQQVLDAEAAAAARCNANCRPPTSRHWNGYNCSGHKMSAGGPPPHHLKPGLLSEALQCTDRCVPPQDCIQRQQEQQQQDVCDTSQQSHTAHESIDTGDRQAITHVADALSARPHMHLPVPSSKFSRLGLLQVLPQAVEWILQHSSSPGDCCLIHDDEGVDQCVCVALTVILERQRRQQVQQGKEWSCSKALVRQALSELSSSYPQARPTRGLLKQVFAFFQGGDHEDA